MELRFRNTKEPETILEAEKPGGIVRIGMIDVEKHRRGESEFDPHL